jgi:plastocyanin
MLTGRVHENGLSRFSGGADRQRRCDRGLKKVAPALCLAMALAALWPPGALGDDPQATLAAVSSETGSVHGSVTITRKLTSQRMRFRPYPGTRQLPPPSGAGQRDDEWRNIVVYLQSSPALESDIASGQTLEIAQEGETFIPHVLPVIRGSTVEFPNHDPIFHNVFSLSAAKTFDLGRYPQGTSRSVTFDQAGIVAVFCHLHSNMSAIVLVLDNAFFVIPDEKGRYEIEGVPAGRYTLVAWHERSERVEEEIVIAPGAAVEVNLTVPVDDEPPAR